MPNNEKKSSSSGSDVIKVGVLACQGSFSEHVEALRSVSNIDNGNRFILDVIEVRSAKDIDDDLKGLIIPGGESTTLNIFLGQPEFFEKLKVWLAKQPIVWGTCAGMILLSDNIEHQKSGGQLKLGGMSITTSRNYWGRQRESFVADLVIVDKHVRNCMSTKTKIDVDRTLDEASYSGIFIRAPGVVSIDAPDKVKVLATLQLTRLDVVPVALQQKNIMVTSFHPELTQDLRFHQYFVELILGKN